MRYDLAIIGSGWAGISAAREARARGMKTCIIESGALGGTCLNRGCIPTKALVQAAKVYRNVQKASVFGIEVTGSRVDMQAVIARKDKVVEQLGAGVQFLLKGVDIIRGRAVFASACQLQVNDQLIEASSILLATGSVPQELPLMPFDGRQVLSSDDILTRSEIPASLLIVGGGVIGCEFASLYAALGSQVTLVEKLPQLLPGEDEQISAFLEKSFTKQGIEVHTAADAQGFKPSDYGLTLVAVGRKPCADGLGLEKCGVAIEKGRVVVDEYLSSNVEGIWAAGDCTGTIMLAHYAAYQGKLAVQNMGVEAAQRTPADSRCVPNATFTFPEVASVGERNGRAYTFNFLGSGMARVLDEAEGLVKIVADEKNNQVIGASLVGPKVTELVAILGVAVQNKLSVEALRETIFAHPTLSEAIADALHAGVQSSGS